MLRHQLDLPSSPLSAPRSARLLYPSIVNTAHPPPRRPSVASSPCGEVRARDSECASMLEALVQAALALGGGKGLGMGVC